MPKKSPRGPGIAGRVTHLEGRVDHLEHRVEGIESGAGPTAKPPAEKAPEAPRGPRCPGCRLEISSLRQRTCEWCGFVLAEGR